MKSVPRNGTRIDIKTELGTIAYGVYYGRGPMGDKLVLRGDQNVLSLEPKRWRPTITEGKTAAEKLLIREEQK